MVCRKSKEHFLLKLFDQYLLRAIFVMINVSTLDSCYFFQKLFKTMEDYHFLEGSLLCLLCYCLLFLVFFSGVSFITLFKDFQF